MAAASGLQGAQPPAAVSDAPPDSSEPESKPRRSSLDAVALLDTIPGVNQRTAEVLVAELRPDRRRFPPVAHAAAWAGVAPGNHESAGKPYSGKTREGNQA
jgi:transposase